MKPKKATYLHPVTGSQIKMASCGDDIVFSAHGRELATLKPVGMVWSVPLGGLTPGLRRELNQRINQLQEEQHES